MASTPEWYYETETGIIGPLSAAELKELIEQSRVLRTVVRIRKGEDGPWLPAERIQCAPEPVKETEPIANASSGPAEWYFSGQDRRKMGPVSWSELSEMASQGKLQPDDQVWRPGMALWVPLSQRLDLPGVVSVSVATKEARWAGAIGRRFRSRFFRAGAAGVVVLLGLIVIVGWSRLRSGWEISNGPQSAQAEGSPTIVGLETEAGAASGRQRTPLVPVLAAPGFDDALATVPRGDRRPLLPKGDGALAQAPRAVDRNKAAVEVPARAVDVQELAASSPSILGSDQPVPVAHGQAEERKPGRNPRSGSITLDMVLATPGSFEGRLLVLDGLYKVGTQLSQVNGPDGNALGWSLPVGRDDRGVVCSGEGKIEGRDT
jgi:hypothetical protein